MYVDCHENRTSPSAWILFNFESMVIFENITQFTSLYDFFISAFCQATQLSQLLILKMPKHFRRLSTL